MRHRSKHGLLFLLLAVMALPLQAAAEGDSREVQAGLHARLAAGGAALRGRTPQCR